MSGSAHCSAAEGVRADGVFATLAPRRRVDTSMYGVAGETARRAKTACEAMKMDGCGMPLWPDAGLVASERCQRARFSGLRGSSWLGARARIG